jgi:predicted RNA methylase
MFRIILLTIFGIVVYFYFDYRRSSSAEFGSPFLPLKVDVIERIMKMAKIKKNDVFYDLGSGDGRLVIAAAKKGAKAYGFEINFFRVWYSRWNIFRQGLSGRAKIIRANLFEVDLSKASIINAYLSQKTNNLLLPKLERELKKGTKVFGVAFKFLKWKPVTINPNGPPFGPIYFYKMV